MKKGNRGEWLRSRLVPPDDTERIKALHHYKILDTPSEETFRSLAETAALMLNMPVGFVAFVDDDRVFYKDGYGRDVAGKSLPREKSVCSIVVLRDEPTVLKDLSKEPCLLISLETATKAGFRFYAGVPIKTLSGFRIGSIAVADYIPREFSEKETKLLQNLAQIAMRELEMRLYSLHEINHLNLTLKIRNTELTNAQRALTESQKELDNFLYRASHDLKGPIATIAGLLHLSLHEIHDPTAMDFLGKIELVNTNMNEALSKLVVIYSLIRDNHHTLSTYLNRSIFEKTIENILFGLKRKIDQKEIVVSMDVGDVNCYGNHQFIHLILSNLIENAVHFHRKSGETPSRINITVASHHDNIILSVFDNGDGIPKEYQPKIFELFFRGNNSSRSGMGLYIVRKLAEKSGGSIRYVSEQGKSTEFIVSLPADCR